MNAQPYTITLLLYAFLHNSPFDSFIIICYEHGAI